MNVMSPMSDFVEGAYYGPAGMTYLDVAGICNASKLPDLTVCGMYPEMSQEGVWEIFFTILARDGGWLCGLACTDGTKLGAATKCQADAIINVMNCALCLDPGPEVDGV